MLEADDDSSDDNETPDNSSDPDWWACANMAAQHVVDHNKFRVGNTFFKLPRRMLETFKEKFKTDVQSGDAWLDEDGGKTGMVRLRIRSPNPLARGFFKWEFEVEDGEMKLECAH